MPKSNQGILFQVSEYLFTRAGLILLAGCTLLLQQVPAHAGEGSQAQHTNTKEIRDILLLKQKSDKLGPSELYLSNNGGKFIARNGDFLAICAPPSWRAIIYCKSRNLAYCCTYEEMNKKTLKLFNHPPLKTVLVSYRPYKSLNLHVKHLTEDGKLEPKGSDDPLLFQERKHKKFASIRYSFADKTPVDPHIQDFVAWLFNSRSSPGIPLELTRNFTDGSQETQYETMAVKSIDEPAEFFRYPTGYNRTPKPIDIFILEDPRSTLEDLFVGNR